MASYECRVILLMLSLYWGSALHPGMDNEIQDYSVRGRLKCEWYVIEEQSCPTWYLETKHNSVTRCVCGATIGGFVMCDYATQKTLIITGLCMSYNETFNDTVVGRCAFNYHYPDTQMFYVTLPNDTSQLNSFMCSGLNRTGLLCSQCQHGLGPAVLSYTRQCVECFDQRYGWLLYITATLIPTTILCFLTMAFQFNVTSAEMNNFVFLCQMVTCASTLANSYVYIHYTPNSTVIHYFVLAVISFYGFWNLDFFRYFIPSFCISSDLTTLHTLALEYVVAIYPLVLTVVIYLCIEMHDRGVRVMVCVWRPFHVCFTRFRRRWDSKGSVINAFATFLLLSYSKLLTVSYSLLAVTELYDNRGKRVGPAVLYYDASIEFFSRQHLPFAVLAICVLLVFVLFPLLFLLLYPMRSFQRCLGYCTRIRWQFLHTFADAFQGCYKNGTSGSHDYRYFAGLYLFFRIVILAAFISPSPYMCLILIPFSVVVSLLFAYFRPYKNHLFNVIDGLGFALLGLTIYLLVYAVRIKRFPVQLLYVMGLIPFMYFILFILYKIFSQVALFRTCCSRIVKTYQAKYENQHLDIPRDDNIDENLPDRIVNPDMYRPLLATTKSAVVNPQSDCQPQASVNALAAYGSM